jgi:hypothetical protein
MASSGRGDDFFVPKVLNATYFSIRSMHTRSLRLPSGTFFSGNPKI